MYSDSRDNMDDPDVSFEFSFTISTLVYPQMYALQICRYKIIIIISADPVCGTSGIWLEQKC